MITPLPSSHCGPRSQVESPSSCFKLGVESGNGRVAWLAWKTRLRCKTIGCRTGPRSASPAHFGAKLFELAWPQRFASLLPSMWWKTVWWSQALQNLNTRLSWNVWGRLGKDLHHANGHSTMSAAWQSLRLKGKQSCLLGRRSNDKGQVSNVPVFGEFWLGPDKVKKSGHNGFSAVAGQGSYGKVLIARGECGRLHAVKVLCGRDAIAEAEHEVVLYQSLQELKDCDRERFPKLLASDCKGWPFPWMSLSFGGLTLARCLLSGERFERDTVSAVVRRLELALVVLHKHARILHRAAS